MNNRINYNKLLNLNHKFDGYLNNGYEDDFFDESNEWHYDEIINIEDNIPNNDDYYNEYIE